MTARLFALYIACLSLLMAGCSSESPTFSFLEDGESFLQNTQGVSAKIDILWVMDNSGSMATSQQNVADNFEAFIDGFTQRDYDFQLAVTTTDAFLSLEDNPGFSQFYNLHKNRFFEGLPQSYKSRFRQGAGGQDSGHFIITPHTPNLINTFLINILQGINGYGDERHFLSLKAALDNPLNAGFLRSDSFLAIIIVTDEDDFSHDSIDFFEDYTDPRLHSVQEYVSYLDNLTGSSGASRRYNVSSIAINDEECRQSLANEFTERKIAHRVIALAEATGGVRADICDHFANSLEFISDKIIELTTQFYLQSLPIPNSIQVRINGQLVPRADQNPGPSSGGWTYNSEANSLIFSGDYLPPQGAQISVTYDPQNLVF